METGETLERAGGFSEVAVVAVKLSGWWMSFLTNLEQMGGGKIEEICFMFFQFVGMFS